MYVCMYVCMYVNALYYSSGVQVEWKRVEWGREGWLEKCILGRFLKAGNDGDWQVWSGEEF